MTALTVPLPAIVPAAAPAPAYSRQQRLLTLENVGVRHGRPILSGVNAAIDNIHRDGLQQGQVVGLLGPSGIGKTQLFRCIAGLQAPDEGRVCLDGGDVPVRAGDVGVVAQAYPLLMHRTVWGNLRVAARRAVADAARGDAEADERCLALLEAFDLAGHAQSYPGALSGGQRQRVAIAQQLLRGTRFLLLDEPFSGLDPLAKDQVCGTLRRVSLLDELNTLVVVTHDIDAALRLCDTVWVLGRGRDAAGQPIAGACIQEMHDLAALGLAWREDASTLPAFGELSTHLRRRFETL